MLDTLNDSFNHFKEGSISAQLLWIVFDWWVFITHRQDTNLAFIKLKSGLMKLLGQFYMVIYHPVTVFGLGLIVFGITFYVAKRSNDTTTISKAINWYLVSYISDIGLYAFNIFLLSGNLRYINNWSAPGTWLILPVSTLLTSIFWVVSFVSPNDGKQ